MAVGMELCADSAHTGAHILGPQISYIHQPRHGGWEWLTSVTLLCFLSPSFPDFFIAQAGLKLIT